ncbi:hypothetical protein E2562_016250 [Oryza meyeriana var. granulata]|uniref:DUF4220 domain-containing protein n=1 Tax=Oryza meyeriana var. granulata TaxID=110450 RepID=A0A6G1CP94_9ORYZ|nr:hypothetical protein E2562_016250 [Oryza meyeriana var. granulata]
MMSRGDAGYESLSCQKTAGLVWNLTSSYVDKSNETSMVSASVLVFALAALFFNLNLFSGISDIGAILDPKVRVILSKALSLFLPVMSYLFSEAKNAGVICSGASAADGPLELSLRARLILVWMLLVELLRKKVEEIRMQAWHTGTVERAGRVAWLGSLVFFNVSAAGRKAVFGILWILCAVKLVQRITYTEVGKRSFAYGKNAKLVISYMAQILQKDVEHDSHHVGDEFLKRCKYLVMGEEDLVIEPIPSGYRITSDIDAAVTTVGKIWSLAESDHLLASLDKDQRLRRLCLSFALFKLLRRSFERLPAMTDAETRHCRDLIFRGLYNGGGGDEAGAADTLFQVMSDEANFLSEYYHSVVPVVLASPFFLLANYVLLPLVVLVLCLVVVVLCGNGDVLFSFRSIQSDSYTMSSGVVNMAMCLLQTVKTSPPAFFTSIDLSITLLLFLIMVYEEVWEFAVFVLSNWFMVSLLHRYTANPQWRDSAVFSWAIRRILWARSKMLSHHGLRFKQFSVLGSCRLSLTLPDAVTLALPILPTVPVPGQVKHSIADYLNKSLYDGDDAFAASNGRSAVAEHAELLPFCDESNGVAEVILTWHIATGILEEKCPPPPQALSNVVATTRLSEYLAYLVAFHPELLPGNQDNTELVFQAMNDELKQVLGFWGYHLPPLLGRSRRFECDMVMAAGVSERPPETAPTVLQKGAALGGALVEKARKEGSGAGEAGVWKVVGDVWVELAVYVASASDEESVTGHRKVLPEGGEFVTVLWTLATQTGISHRPAVTPPVAADTMDRV